MSELVEDIQGEKGCRLPANWMQVRLTEIATINPTLDKSEIDDELLVSFVPMPAVEAETGRIDVSAHRKFAEVKKGYTGFLEDDVLFAKITPCMENGKMAVVPALKNDLGFGSTEFLVLRPAGGISPSYLYYFVSSKAFRIEAERNMTGAVGQRRVPTTFLGDREIPLPPADEQQRIVAKLDELFSELDKGVENLRTAQQQLKVYRQALLKHAFEGRLTAEWRVQNPDKLESAEALLARIQQEREARYQQQLAEWQAAQQAWEASGKTGSKPAKPKVPTALVPLTADELAELPELPAGWFWVQLEALITGIDQGWSPKCENQPTEDESWGVIKTTAIQHGQFFENHNKSLPKNLAPRAQHKLSAGDILITRAGPRVRVGVCCLIRKVSKNLMNCDKAYRIRSLDSVCAPSYLEGVLNSPKILDTLEHIKSGINDSGVNLNQGAFLRLAIPLCSLSEQTALLIELEEKLSSLDQLENTIATSLQQAEALRQSILKKAFSGQLVPQNPDDEPASMLLERIRAERAAQDPTAKRGRKVAKPA